MTFEEYLRIKHMEQYRGVDDDAPDDYERWVSNLDYENFIVYAEEWMKDLISTIRREAVEDVFTHLVKSDLKTYEPKDELGKGNFYTGTNAMLTVFQQYLDSLRNKQ